jgi:hypothetical protein
MIDKKMLGNEIKNNEAFEAWCHNLAHAFVLGVGEICIATLCVIEAHEKAVRVAIIEAFAAFVGAVLHAEQAGYLSDHANHFTEAFVDLFLCDFGFKLEYAVVSDHSVMWVGLLNEDYFAQRRREAEKEEVLNVVILGYRC